MARESRVASRLAVVVSLLLLISVFQCEARAMRRMQSRSNPLLGALFKLNFIRTVEPPPRLARPTGADGDAASLADAGNSPFCVNPPDAPPASTTPPPAVTTPSAPTASDQPPVVPTPSTPSVPDQTPSTPSVPDQSPPSLPLPPITPVPPSFEPSPPAAGGGTTPGGQGGQGGGDQGGGQGGDQGGQGGGQGGQGGQGGGDQGGGQGGGDQGGGQGSSPGSTTPNPPQVGTNPPQVGTAPPSPIVVVPSPPEPGTGSGSGGGSGGGPFEPPIVYPPPLAPPMLPGAGQPVWCVAKPTVPDPIIQEAMDYACGSGAECTSIQPAGACYQPNTILAHASFAFNSYWQQSKAAGGSCDFGGTATIVTRDPSYDRCKFDLL